MYGFSCVHRRLCAIPPHEHSTHTRPLPHFTPGGIIRVSNTVLSIILVRCTCTDERITSFSKVKTSTLYHILKTIYRANVPNDTQEITPSSRRVRVSRKAHLLKQGSGAEVVRVPSRHGLLQTLVRLLPKVFRFLDLICIIRVTLY